MYDIARNECTRTRLSITVSPHITFPSQATTGTPIPALAVRLTKCQNPDPCHVPIISTEVNHLPSRPTISHDNRNTNSLPSFIQFVNTSKIDNSALCRRRSRESTQGIESCHSGGPFAVYFRNTQTTTDQHLATILSFHIDVEKLR